MTQAKVKDIVEKLGLKAEEISDEMLAKIETYNLNFPRKLHSTLKITSQEMS